VWYAWLGLGLVVGACVGVVIAGLLGSAGREDDRMETETRMLDLIRRHHHDRVGRCPYCPPAWSDLR
jgi:hypothetical protein